MANRKDLQSGSIMEVPLSGNGVGFGYVKLIFSEDICPDGIKCIIVKIYNKYSTTPIDQNEFKSEEFETDDLLVYPYLMLSYPPLRGVDKWRLLDTVSLTEEDLIVPDFIQNWKFGGISQEELIIQCQTKLGCGIVRDFQNKRIYTNNYGSIKHMGTWMHYHFSSIRDILTVSVSENMGKLSTDIFSEKDIEEDFWKPIVSSAAIKRGHYFRNMAKNYRLKANI